VVHDDLANYTALFALETPRPGTLQTYKAEMLGVPRQRLLRVLRWQPSWSMSPDYWSWQSLPVGPST